MVSCALFDSMFTIPDYVTSSCGMTDEW